MNIFVKLMLIVTIAFGLNACEDDVIKDYVPRNMVEAYLIVDQPIENKSAATKAGVMKIELKLKQHVMR